MAPKRARRVTFAETGAGQNGGGGESSKQDDDELSQEITAVGGSRARKRSRQVSFEESMGKAEEYSHSLLQDGEGSEGITAFDLEEEVGEGDKVTKEDGVIPRALADLAGDESASVSSSSSGEVSADPREAHKQQARERKAAADEGEWRDAGSDWEGEGRADRKRRRVLCREWVVGDVVCLLASRLRREETPAGLVRRCGREKDNAGLEEATELCQKLVEGGFPDVYEMRREVLLGKCGGWRLRWKAKREEEHGPFDAGQMRGWGEGGYFSQDGNEAEVRVDDDSGKSKWFAAEKVFVGPGRAG